MNTTDPVVKSVTITLEIQALWWREAKITKKSEEKVIPLEYENENSFIEAAEIDDIFEGVSKENSIIEGFIISKTDSTITLSGNVRIH